MLPVTRGRPKNENFEKLGFRLKRINRVYYAVCNICKKYLRNTAANRLIIHRRVCSPPPKEIRTEQNTENDNGVVIVLDNCDYSIDMCDGLKPTTISENSINIPPPQQSQLNSNQLSQQVKQIPKRMQLRSTPIEPSSLSSTNNHQLQTQKRLKLSSSQQQNSNFQLTDAFTSSEELLNESKTIENKKKNKYKSKLKKFQNEIYSTLDIAQNLISGPENNDRDEVFGRFVAAELKSIKNERIKSEVRWAIQIALKEAIQKDQD